MTTEERVESMLETLEISKSGYAGILPSGEIVDRRKRPESIPIEKNEMLGIPKPIKL